MLARAMLEYQTAKESQEREIVQTLEGGTGGDRGEEVGGQAHQESATEWQDQSQQL